MLSTQYQYQDTSLVLDAMKHSMKNSVELQHTIYVMDLFSKPKKKNITTTNIQNMVHKLCDGLPRRREKTAIDLIMNWKIKHLQNTIIIQKYTNTNVWRECKPIIDEGQRGSRYTEL